MRFHRPPVRLVPGSGAAQQLLGLYLVVHFPECTITMQYLNDNDLLSPDLPSVETQSSVRILQEGGLGPR